MEGSDTISKGQVTLLTYGSAAGSIVYTFTWITHVTGKPFWIATFLGVLTNIPFAIWILYLGQHCRGRTIFEMLEKLVGKFIGGIIIVLYIILNIVMSACMLNLFTGAVKVFFLTYTPPSVIMFFVVSACAFYANGEIAALGRFTEILAILFTTNYLIGFLFSFFKTFKIENILPIFDTTVSAFAKGAAIAAGSTAECLMLLMVLVGSLKNPRGNYVGAAKGLIFWAIFLSSAIFIMSGIISPEILSRIAGAGIVVSKVIQLGEFLRGVEVFILVTYQCIAVIKITLYIYSSIVSVRILLNCRYR